VCKRKKEKKKERKKREVKEKVRKKMRDGMYTLERRLMMCEVATVCKSALRAARYGSHAHVKSTVNPK
jgi:hypothetical protein